MDFFDYKNHINGHKECHSRLIGTRYDCPKVSIMIPTFQRPKYLRKAVCSSLSQKTDIRFEVVIIDNDQNEELGKQILNEFTDDRLCYYSNSENIGMFGNWNRCIELARGEWITILSDDDELDENYVEELFGIISKTDDGGAITCNSFGINEESQVIDNKLLKKNRCMLVNVKITDFYLRHPVNIFGCMFRKDLAEVVGGFNEKYYPCSDAVFLIGICTKAKLYYFDKSLFRYRWAVNESKSIDTQLSFARFNNLKSMAINDNYIKLPRFIDKKLRNSMIDYTMDYLIKQRGYCIDRNRINQIKNNMGLDDYCKFSSFVYYLIFKVKNRLFKYRGIQV